MPCNTPTTRGSSIATSSRRTSSLTAKAAVKIADFGLAKLRGARGRLHADGHRTDDGDARTIYARAVAAAAQGRPSGRHLFARRGLLRNADRRIAPGCVSRRLLRKAQIAPRLDEICLWFWKGARRSVSAGQRNQGSIAAPGCFALTDSRVALPPRPGRPEYPPSHPVACHSAGDCRARDAVPVPLSGIRQEFRSGARSVGHGHLPVDARSGDVCSKFHSHSPLFGAIMFIGALKMLRLESVRWALSRRRFWPSGQRVSHWRFCCILFGQMPACHIEYLMVLMAAGVPVGLWSLWTLSRSTDCSPHLQWRGATLRKSAFPVPCAVAACAMRRTACRHTDSPRDPGRHCHIYNSAAAHLLHVRRLQSLCLWSRGLHAQCAGGPPAGAHQSPAGRHQQNHSGHYGEFVSLDATERLSTPTVRGTCTSPSRLSPLRASPSSDVSATSFAASPAARFFRDAIRLSQVAGNLPSRRRKPGDR